MRKRGFSGKGRRQRRGPRRGFGVCKINKNSQSLQKRLERPVPCKQGAADLKASPHAADPIKLLMREMPFVRDVCVFLRLLENDDPQVALERRILSKRVFAVICRCFAD